MKKAILIVICLSIFMSSSSFAYAEDGSNTIIEESQFIAYVNSIIPELSKLPDVSFPVSGLRISNPMEIVNDCANKCVFFLFDTNTCIGIIVASYVEGDFCASFIYKEVPSVSNAYLNATKITLVSYNNSLMMCTESAVELIAGNVLDDEYADDLAQFQSNVLACGEHLALNYVESTIALASNPPYSGLPFSSHTLDVPFVRNEIANGEGLCWAAAAASMIRYLTGHTVVDAFSVNNNNSLENLYLPGTSAAVASALLNYGVTGYTYTTTTIPFQNLTNNIDAGYPVCISMGGTVNGEWACHFVVVCGYYCESDGTDYIQILDSNFESDKIWITINRNTNGITYALPYDSGVYSIWYETIYSTNTN